MTIELLYFPGCPGYERALPTLEALATSQGGRLELRRVETVEGAEVERFLGSPTVRVDGVDVEPGAGERTDFGLKCRVYRYGGEQLHVPAEQWIVDATARARRPAPEA